jgi:hypothetical protein
MVLLQNQPDPEQAMRAVMAIIPLIGFFVIIGLAIVIVPFWFICKKAGFSPWLSLLNLIPLGNLILIYVLAFADWKVMPAPSSAQMGYPFPPPPQS